MTHRQRSTETRHSCQSLISISSFSNEFLIHWTDSVQPLQGSALHKIWCYPKTVPVSAEEVHSGSQKLQRKGRLLFSQLLTEFLFWRTSSTVLYYASTVWAFFRKLISNVSTRQGNCWGRQIYDKCNTSLLCQSQTIDLLAVDICITCAEFKHQFLYQSDPTVLSSPWRSPQVNDSTAAFSGRAWPHPIRSEA